MTEARKSDALDAMVAAPDHNFILLENEQIRVLDTRLQSGQRTPVHSHGWPASLYVISWSDFVRRDSVGNVLVDSRNWEKRPEAGDALWSNPLPPHYVENVGTDELRIIATEMKRG